MALRTVHWLGTSETDRLLLLGFGTFASEGVEART